MQAFFSTTRLSLLVVAALALPCASAFGQGQVYDFDGVDDRIVASHTAAYDGDSFTLEAWVKVDSIPDTDALSSVVSRWTNDSATEVFGLWIQDAGGGCLRPLMAVGGVDTRGFSQGCMTYGVWHHVAAVYDSSRGLERLFIDGAFVGERSVSGSITKSEAALSIGRQTAGPMRTFDGMIDEIRVWDIARDDAELASAAASCLTGGESGLVGYWRFDDDSDRVVRDDSPVANDAMLGGSDIANGEDPLRLSASAPLTCPDRDGDGRADPFDNCPDNENPAQADRDGDGTGDSCDPFPDNPDNLGECLVRLSECESMAGDPHCEADLQTCEDDLDTCARELARTSEELGQCRQELGACDESLSTCMGDLADARADLAEAQAGLEEIGRLLTQPPGRRHSSFTCTGVLCDELRLVIEQLASPPGQSRRNPRK